MYSPTFSPEELEANDFLKLKLVEFVKSGDAILMAGAGSSGAIYPPWREFIAHLQAEAKDQDPTFDADPTNFLTFADRVKVCIGKQRYEDLIYRTFEPKIDAESHLRFHEALCRLPFKGITTTNYDTVLESAMIAVTNKLVEPLVFEDTAPKAIHQFLMSLNYNKGLFRPVVHLHGVYRFPNSIVLTGEEYAAKYGFALQNQGGDIYDQISSGKLSKEDFSKVMLQYGYEWPMRRKLLWSLLSTRRILFVGFSMEDPYFLKMLEFVKSDFSTFMTETHFLLLRTTQTGFKEDNAKANRLKKEYGIETVFFEDDDKFQGLSKFILELEAEVNSSNMPLAKAAISKATDAPDESTGDQKITDKLFELSRKQDENR